MSEDIFSVVAEHIEEASFLWLQRTHAVSAPNYSPQQLADLDERLAAHIDGLRVAGDEGWKLTEATLDNEGSEDFFPAAVLAIEAQDARFDTLLERAKHAPEALPGLISALGWVSSQFLGGRVKTLFEDAMPLKQKLGIAACALHRKDPGPVLDRCLASPVDSVRIRALRTAGELGRKDLLPQCQTTLIDAKPEVRFWAAWSAVLLGDRMRALETLGGVALKSGQRQTRALQLALHAMDLKVGHNLLLQLGDIPDALRLRIIGSGFIGDPRYVPWLIEQMEQPAHARVAAEAFVNITGADFNLDQLETLPPDEFEEGTSEDPDDENVELPEDIALSWPNTERIQQWWTDHQSQFRSGTRCFLGQPVTREHCVHVLKEGYQRQRIAAALYLCLLDPGTQLFPTSAPAWRQQRWLAKMG
ncbi:TIGR02270 family protein [Nitrosospira sp. Nsp13]|uniref:TIGR02270 family protein n=1 Tax=Nitrosospira sp. Nsp13 TaxID=1855332 RepID=UPI000881A9DC|nr:TIGR02270 family protein [Nitrosospira sp. Nsp13]SCX77908.1 conserved hypothetical protein [Nitrosospira sp. Nsp13]